jgi:oligopeptide transport system substrate-binding protein
LDLLPSFEPSPRLADRRSLAARKDLILMWKNLALIGLLQLALITVFALNFSLSMDERADFVFGNNTEPQTLDPAKMTGQPEGRIAQGIFEGLTVYDAKTLKPLPGMAESWDISKDGRTYTFHLRRDAYWVKGAERLDDKVTAHDFVYSWRRMLTPATASQYDYVLYYVAGAQAFKKRRSAVYEAFIAGWQKRDGSITSLNSVPAEARAAFLAKRDADFDKNVGIRAQDDHTLVVTLLAPTPYFTDLTCFYATYPVQRGCVEQHGDRWTRPENIVSNGPFYLERWRFNDRIRLRRNDHYWDRAQVGMETIDALAIEDATTALNMYLKGDVDWISPLPLPLLPELQKRSEPGQAGDYHNFASLTVYFYRVNVTREVFKGERGRKVRQALSLAMDRQDLIDNVTKAWQKPAYGIVPPGVAGYQAAKGVREATREKSVARARRLLAEAGYPDGKGFPKIFLLYNTSEQHKLIAVTMQAFWKESLGIEVELQNQEWGTYLDTQRKLGYDLSRAGWIGDYTDPNTFLDMWITDGPQNNTGWSDPRFDRMIKYAADIAGSLASEAGRAAFLADLPGLESSVGTFVAERDAARRRELGVALRFEVLNRADELIARELPIIPIYFYTTNQLWRPELEGLYDNLRDTHMPKFFRWRDAPSGEGR